MLLCSCPFGPAVVTVSNFRGDEVCEGTDDLGVAEGEFHVVIVWVSLSVAFAKDLSVQPCKMSSSWRPC